MNSGEGKNSVFIKVAREVGVGNGTVQRIAVEMHRPFVAAA